MGRLRSSMGRRFRGARLPLCGVVASLSLAACGGQVVEERELRSSRADLVAAGQSVSVPTSADGCDDLLERFRSALFEQMRLNAEAARNNPYAPVPLDSGVVVLRSEELPGAAAQPAAPAVSPPFSGTTELVSGVDTADTIQADGDRIYLLHEGTLFVLDAADASATQIVASVELGTDGYASQLLVHDGRVVVFSSLYQDPRQSDQYLYYPYPRYFTKLSVIDTNASAPAIVRESYFEGDYLVSAGADNLVRAFVQQSAGVYVDYPPVSYFDLFGDLRSQADIDRQIDLWVELTTATIEESTIEDYLPVRLERVGGELQELPTSCDGLVLPALPQTPNGGSYLISVDLDAPNAELSTVRLFGYTQGAYFDRDTAVLVQSEYATDNAGISSAQTHLHAFQFDGVAGSYAGSGSFSGYLSGLNVDDEHGVLSALAGRDIFGAPPGGGDPTSYLGSASQVLTFGIGSGGLTALGQSPDLPHDEYVAAIRFTDERAYVASSGQQNHLTVVDLADPSQPSIAGNLSLDGYTGVLAPLGADRLLAITQVTEPVLYTTDYVLHVLDVSDPTEPVSAHHVSLGSNVYSEVQYDSRAFSVHADEGIFAFPVQSYDTNSSSLEVYAVSDAAGLSKLGSVVHASPSLTLVECLQLLGYPTDPENLAAFEQDEALSEALLQQCSSYNVASVRRGLFRGDDVYTISTSAVTAHALDALSGPPLSSIPLPSPFSFGPVAVPIASAPVPLL
jgi:hypothetical protein